MMQTASNNITQMICCCSRISTLPECAVCALRRQTEQIRRKIDEMVLERERVAAAAPPTAYRSRGKRRARKPRWLRGS